MPDKVLKSRKIITLRERKGWTQKRLADETKSVDLEGTGINLKTVQNVEGGKVASPRTQALLAAALGVRSEQLGARYDLRRAAPLVTAVSLGVVLTVAIAFHRLPSDDPILVPNSGVLPGLTSDVDYRTGPQTTITAVQVSGNRFDYSLTIDGSGFGKVPYRLPFYGDTPFMRIGDPSLHFEAGYLKDKFAVRYDQWTDRRIVIAHILMRAPGDDIEVGVWNPQTGRGAGWAGSVPPLVSGAPRIHRLAFARTASVLRVRIVGSNFGRLAPNASERGHPFFVDIVDLRYHDFLYHPGAQSLPFVAGSMEGPALDVDSWRDTEIDVSAPEASSNARNVRGLHLGDPIFVGVGNPSTNLITTWAGKIPVEFSSHSGWVTLPGPPIAAVERTSN